MDPLAGSTYGFVETNNTDAMDVLKNNVSKIVGGGTFEDFYSKYLDPVNIIEKRLDKKQVYDENNGNDEIKEPLINETDKDQPGEILIQENKESGDLASRCRSKSLTNEAKVLFRAPSLTNEPKVLFRAPDHTIEEHEASKDKPVGAMENFKGYLHQNFMISPIDPIDIIWVNLGAKLKENLMAKCCYFTIIFIMFLFLSTPAAIIQ